MATQQERTASARERIMDATELLVSQGGSAAASMGAIGEAAGMSRGAANFHFGSKEDLFRALLDRTGARIAERMAEFGAATGSRRDRLEAVVDAMIDDLPSLRTWAFLAYEALGASPFLLETVNAHRANATEHLMEVCDLDTAGAQLVLASGAGILLQSYMQPAAIDLGPALRQAVESLA